MEKVDLYRKIRDLEFELRSAKRMQTEALTLGAAVGLPVGVIIGFLLGC